MLELATNSAPDSFSALLQVRPHHLRSVQIERDYPDPASTLHYVVTPYVDATLRRLCRSFDPKSTARAWRLTGDYGSGKSSFALAFARLAAGDTSLLPESLSDLPIGERLEPVLVVGEREPIGESLMRAIRATADRCFSRVPKNLKICLDQHGAPSPQGAIDALKTLNVALRAAGRSAGLLVIFDELGKNLEYAAGRSDSDDVYLLQHLAEQAARSGATPIVVVAILHQAVASYAASLPSAHRREWEKVAGRYEEVVFAPPIEQNASLIAAALDVEVAEVPKKLARRVSATMAATVDLGWYGPAAARSALEDLAPALLPLDPTVIPVLARLLRRFGQNERSLFSFLASSEPFGLMNHASQSIASLEPYRLHDLYDYVAANLTSLLSSGRHAVRWGVIEEIMQSAGNAAFEDRQVLKVVALLNLIDDPHLSATPEAVTLSVAGTDKLARQRAQAALERLKTETRILYDRGVSGALCLWPNTSVNLDDAFARAVAVVRTGGAGIEAVRSLLPAEPLVARRHYVETGALRHFDVQYIASERAQAALAAVADDRMGSADGKVIVILSETARQRDAILAEVEKKDLRLPETVILGIPEPIGTIAPMLTDVSAWKWVRDNVAELAGDRLARNEVSRQLAIAEARLSRSLEAALDIRGGAAKSICWIYQGARKKLDSGRMLTALLSEICDKAFALSPRVRNELINRRSLSSAAARARFLLIEGLATSADQPALGLDNGGTPPELAIYLSVLKAGKVHVEKDGRWTIQIPPEGEDPLRLRPVLLCIGKVLQSAQDRPVPFEEIAAALREGRYAAREGLIPLLIAIYIAANWHRTAVYEDGTYLEQVGGPEFNRIVKEPEHFKLQHCAIEGVRAEVFSKLASVVGIADFPRPEVLDVVRPLITFVARLPDHARRTRQLSVATATARTALLAGTDPTALIFRDLPRAVGLDPIETDARLDSAAVDSFVRAITAMVRELREAYPSLLHRIASSLGSALEASTSLASLRAELATRAARVQSSLSEPELKAFVLRLSDRSLEDQPWLESVASYVARKPAERWADADEADFHHRLPILARRFCHVEAMQFPGEEEVAGAYRLLVTAADGNEVEHIYRLTSSDRPALASVESKLRSILLQEGRIGRIAAARLLLELDGEGKSQ